MQPKTSSRRMLVTIGLIFLSLMIVLGVVVMATQKPSAKSISVQFVKDVLNNKSAASYKLTSKDFKTLTTSQQWDFTVKKVSDYTDSSYTPVNSANTDQTNKQVQYYYYKIPGSNDSGSYLFTVKLVNESGRWAVEYFYSESY